MKLYGSYTSPYVRHCRIALMQGGLDWQFEETDHLASARGSATQKVPFLDFGDTRLTDSTSILMAVRQQTGRPWLEAVADMDLYCLVNTLMDTAINLFLLEKEGLTPDTSDYLGRQSRRIASGLAELERRIDSQPVASVQAADNDALLRLGCFLDWALFRQRISLDDYPALTALLAGLRQLPLFAETSPPR